MINRERIKEIYACEKLLVDKKEYFYGRYGLRRILNEKSNSRKIRFVMLPLTKLRGPGLVILYIILSFELRKSVFSIFKDKIIFDDHAKRLIQDEIFYSYDSNYKKYTTSKSLHCPLKHFLNFKYLIRAYRSFNRQQPSSPLAFNGLCELWVYYTSYSYLLPKLNYTGALVVDDFSAKRLALILAAKDAGMNTGLVKFSDELKRNRPFLSFDVLFSWNYAQSAELKGSYKFNSQMLRSFQQIKVLSSDGNQSYDIGIALKSLFNEENLIRLLKDLSGQQWVRDITVRFHPSTKNVNYLKETQRADYKVSEGDPVIFFKNIDLLISGSTSLVKEALLAGVPVAYNPFLDIPQGTDFYSYASEGLIYNLEEDNLAKSTLEKIDKFYQSKKWQKMRDQWVSPDPEAISLKEALEKLL